MRVLADFEGDWRLERRIEDAHSGREGRFDGQARFAPDGAGLLYREEGWLLWPGSARMRAERSYLWRAASAGAIDVLFADGRFFHRIAPGAVPKTHHACDPDSYAVEYDFARWPAWGSRWQVSGPRKSYVMVSEYVPLA